jgi:hypothetical protein
VADTLVTVLPLALGGAISPVILLLQLATLASRAHPVGRALVVLAANITVVVVIVAVVVVTDHRTATGAIATGNATDVVGAWIKVVLAVLLAATALRLALEHDKTEGPADDDTGDDTEPLRPMRYFLLGLGAMVSNATTIVLLIPAVHTVATAGLRRPQELTLLAVVSIIVLLPSYLPLVALGALGRRGPEALSTLGRWLHGHQRQVGIAVSAGFAVYLGWSGLAALG